MTCVRKSNERSVNNATMPERMIPLQWGTDIHEVTILVAVRGAGSRIDAYPDIGPRVFDN